MISAGAWQGIPGSFFCRATSQWRTGTAPPFLPPQSAGTRFFHFWRFRHETAFSMRTGVRRYVCVFFVDAGPTSRHRDRCRRSGVVFGGHGDPGYRFPDGPGSNHCDCNSNERQWPSRRDRHAERHHQQPGRGGGSKFRFHLPNCRRRVHRIVYVHPGRRCRLHVRHRWHR